MTPNNKPAFPPKVGTLGKAGSKHSFQYNISAKFIQHLTTVIALFVNIPMWGNLGYLVAITLGREVSE